MLIKPLDRKHMTEVIALLQHLSQHNPATEFYDQIWDGFQAQHNVHALVATESGSIVGYGALIIETKIRGGKLGHIEDIVSHPQKRNMGIGTLLIKELTEIAHQHACYKITLACKEHNIAFYEKSGYSVVGVAMQKMFT